MVCVAFVGATPAKAPRYTTVPYVVVVAVAASPAKMSCEKCAGEKASFQRTCSEKNQS